MNNLKIAIEQAKDMRKHGLRTECRDWIEYNILEYRQSCTTSGVDYRTRDYLRALKLKRLRVGSNY